MQVVPQVTPSQVHLSSPHSHDSTYTQVQVSLQVGPSKGHIYYSQDSMGTPMQVIPQLTPSKVNPSLPTFNQASVNTQVQVDSQVGPFEERLPSNQDLTSTPMKVVPQLTPSKVYPSFLPPNQDPAHTQVQVGSQVGPYPHYD